MNLPNKLTVARIILIPIFVILCVAPFHLGELYWLGSAIPVTSFIATIIFIVAALTDWFDGHLARKYNLITNFGKFADPMADKLLVTAAFIILVEMNIAPAWVIILIISRELAVTGLRLLLVEGGEVLAAGQLGKIKNIYTDDCDSASFLEQLSICLDRNSCRFNFPLCLCLFCSLVGNRLFLQKQRCF
ncbi:CDP-diacylglycerol--glycerol-3-phosphate 3-phosphatidyltransferase [Listeria aquatica FSL S10-1188]|uniref:CDP-diacylglycerol--glycerol-3-phosphate 3-phosphatidyltransferase n=1 Tax=Listeria aquatica FSL S10-1188 TaxID=1265818 RepID=W7AQZ2_9LIST|nr:CDP-diacylglycerol--glycerol-3-phosphate 3-phosphatidyltransferase [Listeria aquatica FSL S10-1188]